jgi:O-antigen/teichoic acid export membrane protein
MKIRSYLKDFKQYKFVTDSAYVLGSYIILAVSGIVTNVLIGNFYGAEGLGVFNQSVAIYMIFSLIAVFGLNTSVVKHIAQYNQEPEIQKEIFTSASLITIGISIVLALFLWVLAYCFTNLYFNKEVTRSTAIIVVSLPFLSQNKIYMALLNALRHMKVYAIIQSARWILIISFILISISFNKSVNFLSYSFLFSEVLILMYFVFWYSKYFSLRYKQSTWYKTHWIFGSKSVLLGFLSETNNRIDIFFISFFLSNYYVGIYSFAAEIAKGFLNIASVIQLNINPIVSNLWEKRDLAALNKYTLHTSKIMFIIIIPLLIIAALAYPLFINIFMQNKTYFESIPVFYTLLAGVFFPAVYYFAGAYLSMANFLNTSLINLLIIIIYNALSCILFIHVFGFYGAAISTSTTYLLSVILMQYYIKKKMGISLIDLKSEYNAGLYT